MGTFIFNTTFSKSFFKHDNIAPNLKVSDFILTFSLLLCSHLVIRYYSLSMSFFSFMFCINVLVTMQCCKFNFFYNWYILSYKNFILYTMMSLFSSCNQCEVFEKEIIPILHFPPQISMKKLSLLKLQLALAIVIMRSYRFILEHAFISKWEIQKKVETMYYHLVHAISSWRIWQWNTHKINNVLVTN
jgi:hypothetical protein